MHRHTACYWQSQKGLDLPGCYIIRLFDPLFLASGVTGETRGQSTDEQAAAATL